MCGQRRTGTALFDLKALFPSMAVLEAYGMPQFIILASWLCIRTVSCALCLLDLTHVMYTLCVA
eukprot:7611258-Pyramimonas_sp.AAC.1